MPTPTPGNNTSHALVHIIDMTVQNIDIIQLDVPV